MRMADCHPDKKHHSKGLCVTCYAKLKNVRKKESPNYSYSRKLLNLKNKYGLSEQEYHNFFIEQENRCAVCEDPITPFGRFIHVDHDHLTKKVRGVLCMQCNVFIGSARDNINILQKAIGYLQTYEINDQERDRCFLKIAEEVSLKSKDPSTKVGVVVVDRHNKIVSVGYNKFPDGVIESEERLNNRELKYKLIVHAEVNAILSAGKKAKGSTLYIFPGFGGACMCTGCCKTAIQAGIKRVVGLLRPIDKERLERWREELEISDVMCKEAGIEVQTYEELI